MDLFTASTNAYVQQFGSARHRGCAQLPQALVMNCDVQILVDVAVMGGNSVLQSFVLQSERRPSNNSVLQSELRPSNNSILQGSGPRALHPIGLPVPQPATLLRNELVVTAWPRERRNGFAHVKDAHLHVYAEDAVLSRDFQSGRL